MHTALFCSLWLAVVAEECSNAAPPLAQWDADPNYILQQPPSSRIPTPTPEGSTVAVGYSALSDPRYALWTELELPSGVVGSAELSINCTASRQHTFQLAVSLGDQSLRAKVPDEWTLLNWTLPVGGASKLRLEMQSSSVPSQWMVIADVQLVVCSQGDSVTKCIVLGIAGALFLAACVCLAVWFWRRSRRYTVVSP